MKQIELNIKEVVLNGDTFKFLNAPYCGNTAMTLQIGDEVLIHPIPGISLAEKSYPAEIVTKIINWVPHPKLELCLKGIKENSDWYGCVINDYTFSRLEFKNRKLN